MSLAAYDLDRGFIEWSPPERQPYPDRYYYYRVVDRIEVMVFPRSMLDQFRKNPEHFDFNSDMREHDWYVLSGRLWEKATLVSHGPCIVATCTSCWIRRDTFTLIKQQLIKRRDSIQRAIDAIAPAFADGDGAIKWRVVQFLL